KRNLESRVEVLVPVEAAPLREQLKRILDLGLADDRNGWVMRADGSYVQRQSDPDRPAKGGSQAQLIADAEGRRREAQRLRRRSLRGISHRNIR
ncbi:MAG TPA: RNA degradosome polyphosphate kinase, partial [Candidatus Methylomirabilis sp.]